MLPEKVLLRVFYFFQRKLLTMTSVEHIRERVVNLIMVHEPDKIHAVNVLMEKWIRKENDLLKILCEKYNESYLQLSPRHLKEVYSIGSKLGNEGFVSIHMIKRRQDDLYLSLKVIPRAKLTSNNASVLQSEINIMRNISHPNILTLYDIYESSSKICLVMDLIQGEQLFDGICKIDHTYFNERHVAEVISQILNGLKYLHSKSIIHGNIKPENVLFVSKGQTSEHIKLIDSSKIVMNMMSPYTDRYDDSIYSAPDLVYTTQSDIYSVGVILYILLCGFPPCLNTQFDQLVIFGFIRQTHQVIPNGIILLCLEYFGTLFVSPYWDHISDKAKDLISGLLETDPQKRFTAAQALQHQWFKFDEYDPDLMRHLGSDRRIHLRRFQCIQKVRRGIKRLIAMERLIEALNK